MLVTVTFTRPNNALKEYISIHKFAVKRVNWKELTLPSTNKSEII